jgi:hypothetical protein
MTRLRDLWPRMEAEFTEKDDNFVLPIVVVMFLKRRGGRRSVVLGTLDHLPFEISTSLLSKSWLFRLISTFYSV